MYREEERQRRHGLLATREVLHVAESLERRHGVVFDAGEVRRVAVFDVEVGLAAEREGGAAGEVFVDVGDLFGDVRESFVEEVEALLLHLIEGLFGVFGCEACVFEVLFGGFEAGFHAVEALDGAHVGIELFEVGGEGIDCLLELFVDFVVGIPRNVSW